MKHYSLLRVAAALLLVITLSLTIASPALAALDLNPANYYQFNFNPTTFDKSEVAAGEVFHATITGSADCTKDLPLPISEIKITSQVVAQPAAGGAALILNPQYIIDINPLPRTAGGTFNINQTVTLQFPAGATPGSYNVVGQVTLAKVTIKVIFSYDMDVTSSFSQDQTLGTIKCIIPTTATTPAKTAATSTTAPATAATTLPRPMTTYPASSTTTAMPTIRLDSPPTTNQTVQTTPVNTLLMIAVIVIGVVVVAVVIVIVLVKRRRGI
jgi:hypothetical protein